MIDVIPMSMPSFLQGFLFKLFTFCKFIDFWIYGITCVFIHSACIPYWSVYCRFVVSSISERYRIYKILNEKKIRNRLRISGQQEHIIHRYCKFQVFAITKRTSSNIKPIRQQQDIKWTLRDTSEFSKLPCVLFRRAYPDVTGALNFGFLLCQNMKT